MVIDREGYSPDLFSHLWQKRIALLTYHKFPKDDWKSEEFDVHNVTLAGGEAVTMQLAERGTQLSNKLWGTRDPPAHRQRPSDLDADDQLSVAP